MITYQSGSTVKLTANFVDTNNTAFDPDTIDSIKIYTPDKTQLASYTSEDTTKETVGKYYLYYTLPAGYSHVYHEWNYTYNSVSDLVRDKISISGME